MLKAEAEKERRRRQRDKQTSIWSPLPGPQTDAYNSDADELFYGGAAGGGKTDLLLGLASTQHLKSIIYRREYPQLKGIIERSRELFTGVGRFNAQDNIWRLGERLIEFGAVQQVVDVAKYQGRAHDLKCFDELTHFTESQYTFLIGWTRTTRQGQRTRVVSAGNPPTTAEGEWVIRRWGPWLDSTHHNPAGPGELRWFATLDGKDTEVESGEPFEHKGETVQPRSRTFIPARLTDNPYLLGTGYMSTLQNMPEPLRSQMLYGDFTAGLDDDPWQVIPTEWVRAAQARWTPEGRGDGPMSSVGVDVARGGKDKTVLARRYGKWFAPLDKYPGAATPNGQAVAGLVMQALTEGGYAAVDVIGVGSSAYDWVVEQGGQVAPVNFAVHVANYDRTNTLRFVNLRAFAYWSLREALDPDKGDSVALPPDPELLADLTAPRYSMRLNGIQVESKEDIIKRLDRSPDCADAVVLASVLEVGGLA